jgi:hypothetical protein
MKIAQPLPRITAEKAPVKAASPDLDAAVRNYLAGNSAGIPFGASLGAAHVNSRFTLGAPVSISPSAKLLPIFDANEAADHISAMEEASQPPTMTFEQVKILADNSAALLEQMMPEPPAGVGVAFHIIGVLRTAPGVVTAFKQTGPKRRTAIAGSLIKFLASFGVLLADIPGLERGKPAAETFSLVVKAGEQFLVVPASDLSAVRR